MSEDLSDIIEELTHVNDLCRKCDLPYNECVGHKPDYDNEDWVGREHDRDVPKELSPAQIKRRAVLQQKRRELRALIHNLKDGDTFMFDEKTPKYEGSSVLWEHASEPAVFKGIEDTVVKYQLVKNPFTTRGEPKHRFMSIYRFAKYFRKLIGANNDNASI